MSAKDIPEELTITFAKPIEMSGKDGRDKTVYSEMTLREPKLAELTRFVKKAESESGIEAMRFLISMVSGIPLVILDEIKTSAFYEAMNYMTLWVTPPEKDDPEGNAGGSRVSGSIS
jgi:Phage tail assembly chaperone proteins, E, or 41 or 14